MAFKTNEKRGKVGFEDITRRGVSVLGEVIALLLVVLARLGF